MKAGVLVGGITGAWVALAACSLSVGSGLTGGTPDAGGAPISSSNGGTQDGGGTTTVPGTDGGTTTNGEGGTTAPAAPTFVSVSSSSDGASKLTIDPPAGVQAGDYLLGVFYMDDTGIEVTPPAGWTELQKLNNCEATMYFATAVATAGMTAQTFTINQTDNFVGGIVAYRGVSTTKALDNSFEETFMGDSFSPPQVTPTTGPDMLVILVSNDGGDATDHYSESPDLQKRLDIGILGIWDAPQTASESKTPLSLIQYPGGCGAIASILLAP